VFLGTTATYKWQFSKAIEQKWWDSLVSGRLEAPRRTYPEGLLPVCEHRWRRRWLRLEDKRRPTSDNHHVDNLSSIKFARDVTGRRAPALPVMRLMTSSAAGQGTLDGKIDGNQVGKRIRSDAMRCRKLLCGTASCKRARTTGSAALISSSIRRIPPAICCSRAVGDGGQQGR